MNYPEIIEAYRGLKNKCFLVTETYSEQGSWEDEISVIPKVYATIDDLIKDYKEDDFIPTVYTNDGNEEFDYEKQLLIYNEMPKYLEFRDIYKKYLYYLEKLYISRYNHVFNESSKLMSDRELKSNISKMEHYAKEFDSMVNYNPRYTVIVADKIGNV